MLRNYLKIAFRNLIRNPVYSAINIFGLSLGIATSVLIGLWVTDEITYNYHHKNIDNLYHVRVNATLNGGIQTWAGTSYIVYDELKRFPSQIKNVTISTGEGTKTLLTYGDNKINKGGRFVTHEFLEMFQFELAKGQANKVLIDPHSIVLTESTAKVLFGDVDPINKVILVNNKAEVKVTGILKDIPGNSSFEFDFLSTFELKKNLTPWVREAIDKAYSDDFEVYVELASASDLDGVNQKIKNTVKKHTTWLNKEQFLYPMTRWHLHGEFENGVEAQDDREDYVVGFSIIAIGVLAMACINFMNLSTARSERRAREVGIRKIVGSQRKELIIQFLRESILITTISFMLAMVLVELSLPLYNSLVQKKLFIDYTSAAFWVSSFLIISITGLLAGSYPAFFLSSFKPVKVLKGIIQLSEHSILPRKILVVSQFTFSIFLIIGTIVIYQQIQYAANRRLGYDKKNLITIANNEGLSLKYPVLKNELLRSGVVLSSVKSNSPVTEIYEKNFLEPSTDNLVNITNIYTEYDYCKTMGIKLIAGRDFSENIKVDTGSVILNQTAAKLLEVKNPIGSKVNVAGHPYELIGITEDILMDSPYHPIEPLYMVLETEWNRQTTPQNITIRLKETSDIQSSLKKIEAVFNKVNPDYPFEFSFVDDDYNRKFKSINLIGSLVDIFATIAVCIACLGLFGLAAFTAERRTKEFGVRKILGASTINLISLISNDFIRLVGISFIISAPIAWWILTNFLERYPYHILFNWLIIPLAGLGVLLVTLVIVGTQAIKVANNNPVDSLRSE